MKKLILSSTLADNQRTTLSGDLLRLMCLAAVFLLSSCMDSSLSFKFPGSGAISSLSYFAESEPDGSGVRYEDLELEINDTATLYAIKRDSAGNYVENIAVSWSKDGIIGSLTIVGDGEAAEFTSPDIGNAQIKILDDGEVVKVIDVTVSYPPSSPVEIETLALSDVTEEGFSASLAYTGDYEANSVHTLYYCNQSSGACDPEVDGGSIVMTRGTSEYTAEVSGLTMPTDDFAVRLISEDVDGVIGTATQDTVVTLDGSPISISGLAFTNASKDGGTVRIDSTGDLEENASVSLFYCNRTAVPSCDPSAGVEVAMNKIPGGYEVALSGLSATMDEGDELALRVVATDPDGTDGSPLSATDYLADLRLSGITSTNEITTGFTINVVAERDSNMNGSATLYYCNETLANGCDPMTGTSEPMVRDGSSFTVDISGLDGAGYSANDLVNVRVTGADPDGAKLFEDSLSKTVRLADVQMQDFIITEIKRDSFLVYAPAMKPTILPSASVEAYFCDATANPGCDPITFGGSAYNMTYSNWPHRYRGVVNGFTGVPGNTINVAVEYYSPEGVYVDGNEDATRVVLNQTYKVPVATDVYRSVGPGQNYALFDGGSAGINLSITSDEAIFSSNLSADVGVGDVIFFDSTSDGNFDSFTFINSRISNSIFSVQAEYGGSVADLSSTSSWVLYRAYTSASNAITGTLNAAISADSRITNLFDQWPAGKKDISARTGLDISFNVALYAGDEIDTAPVSIDEDDWNKDRDNKIRLFVPYKQTHVGASQRHLGVWDESKYMLSVTDTNAINIDLDNITIEGLQIDLRGSVDNRTAVMDRNNIEGLIANNIIRNSSTGESLKGVLRYEYANRASIHYGYYINNIIYNFNTPGSFGFAVDWQSQDGGYVLNNTFYNNRIGVHSNSYRALRVENNISVENTVVDYFHSNNSIKTLFNNIDSDNSISLATPSSAGGNIANITAASLFVDAENGDFRLLPGADAIDSGKDLSSRYTIDISGATRDANFDIGAFEYLP